MQITHFTYAYTRLYIYIYITCFYAVICCPFITEPKKKMSNLLWKKLHLCFSSSSGGHLTRSSPSVPSSSPSTKTDHNRPFHRRHHHHHHTPSIFIHNFNFLYDHLSSPHHRRNSLGWKPSSRVATVFSSKPRRRPGVATEEEDGGNVAVSKLLTGGVAVMKHVESPDPYRDFRRSMREMVEARNSPTTLRDVAGDREFLHELLFCYLSLNPKHTHKFIVSAFADTLASLFSPPPGNSG
ncbi:PREDICTED: LOW QUALITY PROTEIN: transcription repressor OFP11 [Tarenaya hassleriana]|uniref:LOW QUALITY PROTEIN: transcription repressor OFP11 n=1 Tax=Tarenaya hassleriana TaxID=28532 RepID=UPI0008FD4827|nr:PREDICTED: LOW QUALITY PROTEIN: transcription repressor OFP11 [Tarenaya hassleriana]